MYRNKNLNWKYWVIFGPKLSSTPGDQDWQLYVVGYFGWLVACGPGSSVGIATALRAGRSGIESQWGRDFLPLQAGPVAHPASCKMGTGSFTGG